MALSFSLRCSSLESDSFCRFVSVTTSDSTVILSCRNFSFSSANSLQRALSEVISALLFAKLSSDTASFSRARATAASISSTAFAAVSSRWVTRRSNSARRASTSSRPSNDWAIFLEGGEDLAPLGERVDESTRGVIVLVLNASELRFGGAVDGRDARSAEVALLLPDPGEREFSERGERGKLCDAAEYIRCFDVFPDASIFFANCVLLAFVYTLVSF
mmetsp:Transcript_73884/g.119915  ORF Transcript_73884/g.119915 Transcript_73884/m.119915 type:complete len:218 (+) Transcript_73884:334-987(+)